MRSTRRGGMRRIPPRPSYEALGRSRRPSRAPLDPARVPVAGGEDLLGPGAALVRHEAEEGVRRVREEVADGDPVEVAAGAAGLSQRPQPVARPARELV